MDRPQLIELEPFTIDTKGQPRKLSNGNKQTLSVQEAFIKDESGKIRKLPNFQFVKIEKAELSKNTPNPEHKFVVKSFGADPQGEGCKTLEAAITIAQQYEKEALSNPKNFGGVGSYKNYQTTKPAASKPTDSKSEKPYADSRYKIPVKNSLENIRSNSNKGEPTMKKYKLPKQILIAKESADLYNVDPTAHPSTSFPIPTTRFQTEFLDLAEQLKSKVGLAPAKKRVERPKNNTKLDKNGKLVGEVDTDEDLDDKPVSIDLRDKAKTVYEGTKTLGNEAVKRPNFKRISKKSAKLESEQPIKDEMESEDKQPKEAVACESDWELLTRRERSMVNSGDILDIRRRVPAKARQDFLISKIRKSGLESAATEGEEDGEVKYYVYKFFEDGSLINTAYTNILPAASDYTKTEGPAALVNLNQDSNIWELLESKDIEEAKQADILEAIAVLNEDGNPMLADVTSTESSKRDRSKSIKVSKEELGLSGVKPFSGPTKPKKISKESYVIKSPYDDSITTDGYGEIVKFSTESEAIDYASKELGMLEEDFEVVLESAIPASEFISSTWYAMVATEGYKGKDISKITISSDKPAHREAVKEHLQSVYGTDAVYSITKKIS